MVKIFLFFILLFCSVNAFGQTQLKNQQPNWKFEVTESHPNGTPLKVEYYAPLPKTTTWEKVKIKLFRADGSLAEEQDLENGTPHGGTIYYDSNEKIASIALFQNGQLEGILRNYDEQGVLRDKFSYSAGILNGPYEHYSSQGVLFEKGTYKNGKKEGEVFTYFESGQLVKKENYLEGLLHGELHEYYPNGQPSAIWNYQRGLLHGTAKTIASTKYSEDRKLVEEQDFRMGQPWGIHRIYKKGNLKTEEIVTEIPPFQYESSSIPSPLPTAEMTPTITAVPKPLKNGSSETFYDTGAKRSLIEYKEGKLHGKKILWSREGEILEEATYHEGNLEGRYRSKEQDGSEVVAHYKNNLLDGLFEKTHPPHEFFGKLKALECRYKEGLLDGDLIEYNIAGTKTAQIPYKEGKRQGKALYFTPQGVLSGTIHFDNDIIHGKVEEFHPNGATKSEVFYKQGNKEGKEVHYFNQGKIKSIAHYQNGKLHGESKEWNQNGALIFEGLYEEGNPKGTFRRYDENGQIKKEKLY